MKISTIILLVVFFCLALTSKSQFTKGEKLLGGNAFINFSSTKSESVNNPTYKTRPLSLSISPRMSWVTKESQMMGIMLSAGYSYSKSFAEGSQDYQTSNSFAFSTGYFLRHYKSFNSQVGWFIEYNISGGYSRYKNKNIYMAVDTKSTGKSYSVGTLVYPGFYYKISPRTLFEASFGGLNAVYSKIKNETSSNSLFSVGASFPTNLALGVQFFLVNKNR